MEMIKDLKYIESQHWMSCKKTSLVIFISKVIYLK